MITLQVNGKPVQVASCWAELSPAQVITYARDIAAFRSVLFVEGTKKTQSGYRGETEYWYTQGALLKILFLHQPWVLRKATPEQRHGMIVEFGLCKFFFDISQPGNLMQNNPVPFVTIRRGLGKKKLYGPVKRFDQVCALEYCLADYFFNLYTKTAKPEHLDAFIAVLYRPAGKTLPGNNEFTGDIRLPFNENNTQVWDKWIKKMPYAKKLAVCLWFTHIRMALVKRYPRLFKKGESKNENTAGFMDLLHEMAGEKFGTVLEAQRVKIMSIMHECERVAKQNEELKRRSR
jgi:hypothetical protein